MGSLCSKAEEPQLPLKQRMYSKEEQVIVTPGNFVTENMGAFYEYYNLDRDSLGSGAWGVVKKCTHKKTGETRVVKIISKAELPRSMIESKAAFHEAQMLKNLDHPNLPRVFEFFEDLENYYIVMEFIKGGDLFDRIVQMSRFNECQASEIMSQILRPVNYLHSRGIVHRDIKPENILMSDPKSFALKLVDFDTATVYRNSNISKMYGTPLYMAPEIVRGRYDEKCDLWSCGVILYILLKGEPPYYGTDEELFSILKKIKKIELDGYPRDAISAQAFDLLTKMLEPNPKLRISASEACSHPWIVSRENINEEDVLNIMQNLKNFKQTSKIKEVIHTFIISKVADPLIFKNELAMFNLLDVNKDGAISADEIFSLMISRGVTERDAKKYAELIMKEADTDKSGVIDFTEFLRASTTRNKILTKDHILQAFRMLDKDNSGTIEAEELKQWISGDNLTSEQVVDSIISQVDRNGDGKIDLEEFEALLLENIQRRSLAPGRSIELDRSVKLNF